MYFGLLQYPKPVRGIWKNGYKVAICISKHFQWLDRIGTDCWLRISTLDFSFNYDDCLIIQAPLWELFYCRLLKKEGSVETPP
jgi:hypothetical protein